MSLNYRGRTYFITSQIPEGKVLTYQSLALLASVPSPRLVGLYLHQNPDPNLPCYRVVNSQGKIAHTYAFGGGKAQAEKLNSDGVIFNGKRLDLKKYLWQPSPSQLKNLQNRLNQI